METEAIDKLFLELSQVTTAKTRKEISLEQAIINALKKAEFWCPQKRDWENYPKKYEALLAMYNEFKNALETNPE